MRNGVRNSAPIGSTPRTSQATLNSLLSHLPGVHEQERVDLQPVALTRGQVLQEQGELPSYLFFPTTSVVSMLTSLESADAVEVASIGREGVTNLLDVWIERESSARLVVEIPGQAYVMNVASFRRNEASYTEFKAAAHAYGNAMVTMMAHAAACYRHHTVRQQCARWLLLNHARLGIGYIPVTHELLADSLGVFRPTVSIALGDLQERGVIKSARGRILVLDREGLEELACRCHGPTMALLAGDIPIVAEPQLRPKPRFSMRSA